MGSYDPEPEGWDQLADEAWMPRHVIFCSSKWMGQDRHEHPSVPEVKACFEAARDEAKGIRVWPCSWLNEGRTIDGTYTWECGAPTRYTGTDGSYECEAGHDFVPPQTRQREGWDYAADEGEATLLGKYGVEPRTMQGGAWIR